MCDFLCLSAGDDVVKCVCLILIKNYAFLKDVCILMDNLIN